MRLKNLTSDQTNNQTENLEKKSGAIPWIQQNNQILMMFMTPSDPRYGGSQPQIAKGGQDTSESVIHAAIREAQEELGLRASNIRRVLPESVSETVQGSDASYQLTVYALEVKNTSDFGQPDFETGSVHWLTLQDFLIRGRQNQANIVRQISKIISKNIS